MNRRADPARILALVLVVGFVAVFLGIDLAQISAPFGETNEGRNGGVWASGSRCLRDHGLVASRLGARLEPSPGACGGPYVDHPPLILVETAISETVFGEHRWASRAPAWLGTVAAILLTWELLVELGAPPLAAAVGVACGFGCPMVGVFGTMLDTWIVGLPWGVASLLLWQRQRAGHQPASVLLVVATAGAIGTSWMGWITIAIICAVDCVGAVVGWRPLTRGAIVRKVAAVASAGLVLAWMVWASGTLSGLGQVLAARSGRTHGLSTGVVAHAVAGFARDVFTPWQLLLVVPLLVLGVRQRTLRPVLLVATASVLVWTVVFRDGAALHAYWAYWAVVPLSCVAAVAATRLWAISGSRFNAVVWAGLATAAVALGCLGLDAPSISHSEYRSGEAAGRELHRASFRDQPTLFYMGYLSLPTEWLNYESGLGSEARLSIRGVMDLARTSPSTEVFVDGGGLRASLLADPAGPCPTMPDTYAVTTAAALALQLQATCPHAMTAANYGA